MPEFRKVLVLSTGHLSPSTRDWLTGLDWRTEGPSGGPYAGIGWFIYAHEENASYAAPPMAPSQQYPPDLMNCFEYARHCGCDNVLFDCDGPREDDLPWLEPDEGYIWPDGQVRDEPPPPSSPA